MPKALFGVILCGVLVSVLGCGSSATTITTSGGAAAEKPLEPPKPPPLPAK